MIERPSCPRRATGHAAATGSERRSVVHRSGRLRPRPPTGLVRLRTAGWVCPRSPHRKSADHDLVLDRDQQSGAPACAAGVESRAQAHARRERRR